MKFYLRIVFLIILTVILKVIFDTPFFAEVKSLQEALKNKFLIKDKQTLIINMKKVFKTKNPKHVFNRLLEFGGNINAEKADGTTPLIFSAQKGNKDLVKLLISYGANTAPALFHFILTKNTKAAGLLIRCGANPNVQDKDGLTPLLFILINCLERGFSFEKNIFDKPIDNKAIQDTLKLAKLFLAHGANPNVEFNNMTSLTYAFFIGNNKLTKLLLNYGANPNIKLPDETGLTPLMEFTLLGDYEMVRLLLEKGADVNYQDNFGKTALFYAQDKAMAELFIDKCSDINFKDYKGYTPLHWAAHQKNEQLVQFLLSKGADATIKNDEGRSALDNVAIG